METSGIDLIPAVKKLYGHVPPGASLRKLKGDASNRTYYRLTVTDGSEGVPESVIVMHLPEDALKQDELGSGPPPIELPFLNVHRMLSDRGLPVPRIYVQDVERRVILLEDLGDETFEARLRRRDRQTWPKLYAKAVDLLAEMHVRCETPDGRCIAYRRSFDASLLRAELDHFREWGIEAVFGKMQPKDRAELDQKFDALAGEIARSPRGLVHRDYQSRNLMWAADGSDGSLVILDFQDALMGPRPYDLAALLCDSYVALDSALQRSLLTRYLEKRKLETADENGFNQLFWKMAAQRKLKDAGRFVFMDRRKANSDFLRWYAPTFVYIGRALSMIQGYDGLQTILQRIVPGYPDNVATPSPARKTP